MQSSCHGVVAADKLNLVHSIESDSLVHDVLDEVVSQANINNLQVEDDHLESSVGGEHVHPLNICGDGGILLNHSRTVDILVVLSDETEDHVSGSKGSVEAWSTHAIDKHTLTEMEKTS